MCKEFNMILNTIILKNTCYNNEKSKRVLVTVTIEQLNVKATRIR